MDQRVIGSTKRKRYNDEQIAFALFSVAIARHNIIPNKSLAQTCQRTSHRSREHIWRIGARPAIPQQRHEAPPAYREWIYANRHQVERLWARLKEWQAVATRYEKTAAAFISVLSLAVAFDWIKR